MVGNRFLAAVLAACLSPAAAPSPLAAGDPAPELAVESWLNVQKGQEPTVAALRGKVVMVEFWGTWCGPCVRAMPHVQELWDRYRDRGLVVLAISYEAPADMKGFLERNALTMPVGSDPSKAFIGKFGFSGWPATYVIDREWKVAWVGDPYGAEAAVEKALGLETSPGALLSAYLAVQAGKDGAGMRAALERLVEKAPRAFDLKAWAAGAGGKVPEDGKAPPKVDPEKALARLLDAAASAKEDRRAAILDELAAGGPGDFDLAAWARDLFGREYPITGREMQALLDEGRFLEAVDALIGRHPAPATSAAAAKHAGLREFSRKKAGEIRSFARKGLMALHWPIAGKVPRNNDAFWKDLAVSGVVTKDDGKEIAGVFIGGEPVTEDMAAGWIDREFGRALLMEDVASSGRTNLGGLAKEIAKERESTLRELKSLYE